MSAQALRVTVRAEQRLLLGTGAEVAYFTGTHRYIPGSVLRGALAAVWIADHGPPTGDEGESRQFRELFDGSIRYGPLHVEGSVREPLSVWRCKYPQTAQCAQVAVDRAFDDGDRCPTCDRSLVPAKGEVILPEPARPRRTTRTAIDEETGRAKEGQLYARDGLPAGTTFTGLIHGSHPWLTASRTLRLGGRRTVGGAASYQAEPVPIPPVSVHGGRLVLRLLSPAVFVDAAGRPRLAPDPTLDLAELKIARSWADRPVTLSGWHAASRLPKPAELAAAAGATYLLEGDDQRLSDLANRVSRTGWGLRRSEGYGMVEVVTAPWRPPAPVAAPAASTDDLVAQVEKINGLLTDDTERRWLIGALRTVQIEDQRHDRVPPRQLADQLLRQPTAVAMAARPREEIRDLLGNTKPGRLRELTTMLDTAPPEEDQQ